MRSLIAQRMKGLQRTLASRRRCSGCGQHAHPVRWHSGAVNPGLQELYSAKSRGQSHPAAGAPGRPEDRQLRRSDQGWSGRTYLTKGGRVQVRSLIAQRMKGLAKDPGLQEKVLRVLGQHEHIRMYGGTQCAVNPGLQELYSAKSRGQSHPDAAKGAPGRPEDRQLPSVSPWYTLPTVLWCYLINV